MTKLEQYQEYCANTGHPDSVSSFTMWVEMESVKEQSSARILELEKKLAEQQAEYKKLMAIFQERDALQARIDAAEKQEPHCWLRNGYVCFDAPAIGMEDEYVPLYTHPAIPPELQSLSSAC